MALLKHNPAGFLVGELIDVERDLLKAHQQGLTIWRDVRTDVSAIARAMGVRSTVAAWATPRPATGSSSGVAASRNSPARRTTRRLARRLAWTL
jgi:hypothetical protein